MALKQGNIDKKDVEVLLGLLSQAWHHFDNLEQMKAVVIPTDVKHWMNDTEDTLQMYHGFGYKFV